MLLRVGSTSAQTHVKSIAGMESCSPMRSVMTQILLTMMNAAILVTISAETEEGRPMRSVTMAILITMTPV